MGGEGERGGRGGGREVGERWEGRGERGGRGEREVKQKWRCVRREVELHTEMVWVGACL